MAFTAGQKLRASDLVAIDPRGTFSKYSGTTTALTFNTVTAIPFATLSQGAGTGLSVSGDNKTFTMTKAGLWLITCQLGVGTAGFGTPSAAILILYTSTGFTTALSQNTAPPGAGQMWNSVHHEMTSDGTNTVVVAADALALSGNGNVLATPTLSFKWLPE